MVRSGNADTGRAASGLRSKGFVGLRVIYDLPGPAVRDFVLRNALYVALCASGAAVREFRAQNCFIRSSL